MGFHTINPLVDNRWDDLVAKHELSSAFHQRGWLEALHRTYNYQPFVVSSSAPGEALNNGIALCRVSSWITGTRLVSLPFTDHFEPVLSDGRNSEIVTALTTWLRQECDRRHCRYVELRTNACDAGADQLFKKERRYYLHRLDLTPSIETIFAKCHKDCVQRRVRHAERERLSYESDNHDGIVDEFYHLLTMTRRRHRLVPQPRSWFRNLVDCMGDAIRIRLARKNGRPIAAILTMAHKSSIIYKYGCSDARYHRLGGVPFLLWKLIEESKASGAQEIDFGRTDFDNPSLVVFKDRFGTKKSLHTYLCYRPAVRLESVGRWASQKIRQVVPVLPDVVLPLAGSVIYRHVG